MTCGYILNIKERGQDHFQKIPYGRIAGIDGAYNPAGECVPEFYFRENGGKGLLLTADPRTKKDSIVSIVVLGGELGFGYGHSVFLMTKLQPSEGLVELCKSGETVRVESGKNYRIYDMHNENSGALNINLHSGKMVSLEYKIEATSLSEVDTLIDDPKNNHLVERLFPYSKK